MSDNNKRETIRCHEAKPETKRRLLDGYTYDFLKKLIDNDGTCYLEQIYPSHYESNKARNRCRRNGWAKFDGLWHITEEGRKQWHQLRKDLHVE
jgi:hypothetical protein